MCRTGTMLMGALLVLATTLSAARAAEHVETITTRPGVTQGVYIVEPDSKPWGVALLYVGGDGNMKLDATGPTDLQGNFLLRITKQLRSAGLLLVYPDVPSDMRSGLGNLRNGDKHVVDAAAIVAAVRQRSDAPLFVIGTSRGTMSAANIAGHLPSGTFAGVILTSSITRASKQFAAVDEDALAAITAPTLVMHNREDACSVTKPADIPHFVDALKAAPRKDLVWMTGGESPKSGPCDGKSRHGYFGIEREATNAMLDWMKSVATAR